MKTDLPNRMLDLLREAGSNGLRRSALGSVLRANSSMDIRLYNHCLAHLHTVGFLRSEETPNRGFGHRGYITYYATDLEGAAPPLPPMLEMPSTLAIPDPIQLSHSASCVWCGKQLPPQHGGRPRQFCNMVCRTQQIEAGTTQVGAMFMRIALTDPRRVMRMMQIAYYFAVTDLTSRGTVATLPEGVSAGFLLFKHDAATEYKRVDIFVARSDAHDDYYQGPISGAIRAVVYRNGRIRYEPSFDEPASERVGGADDESTPP